MQLSVSAIGGTFARKIYDQQAPGQLRHFCDGTFVFAFIRQRLLLTRVLELLKTLSQTPPVRL
ncbi:hypothetical protein OUZ56_015217 [Daphnia magna]|uniref:Uncharacterized protein n=1 Tax=Daphnia magna TaxID=35525 RepID=A0ABR0AMD2_9CRUS|nr:hypothetical protein OUZ56_015217 [Daphnia magna]